MKYDVNANLLNVRAVNAEMGDRLSRQQLRLE